MAAGESGVPPVSLRAGTGKQVAVQDMAAETMSKQDKAARFMGALHCVIPELITEPDCYWQSDLRKLADGLTSDMFTAASKFIVRQA